jgi:putative tryptophan/tyrosine transport system substrate-binding protein
MRHKYSRPCILPVLILFWLTLAFPCQIILSIPEIKADEDKAIIIRSNQGAAYDKVIEGFKEGCKGKNISIKAIYDLKGDIEEGKKVIKKIKGNNPKPNLIMTVGILAATLAKEQFDDIPIIFCMVIYHERFNLDGDNITGISIDVPLEDQFTILKELLGKDMDIGVIYDPENTGNIVSEANEVSKKLGQNLVKKEVMSESEVVPALKKIAGKIDALWIIPDCTVVTQDSLSIILKEALKHRLPTFCTSDAIVRAGSFASISPDYTHIGLQAAQTAQALLDSPTVISMGIRQPGKLKLSLNVETANIIGVNISAFESRPDVILYP